MVGLIELLRPLRKKAFWSIARVNEETEIDKFAVIERDGMIVGCAAMYPIPVQGDEVQSAEIA